MRKISMMILALVLTTALLTASSFAATSVSSSVFPSVTVPGGTVVFHTGVANTSAEDNRGGRPNSPTRDEYRWARKNLAGALDKGEEVAKHPHLQNIGDQRTRVIVLQPLHGEMLCALGE
jgi:hypothetical protein